MDSVGCRAVIGAKSGKSGKARVVAGMIERDRIRDEIRPENLPDTFTECTLWIICDACGQCEARATIALKCDGDGGMRHGDAFQHIGDGLRFCAVGLEEFEAGGGCEEEIGDFDTRAALDRCRAGRMFQAGIDKNGGAV